jgi:branched-chain amino acid transport system substrate-binding protein
VVKIFGSSADLVGARRRRSRTYLTILAAAGLVTLGACSSSSSSSPSAPSTSAASSAPASTPASTPATATASAAAATGSPYVIGDIASISGPYATSIGGTPNTVNAWEQWTNAHGGINGHPVKVIVEDDASVPAKGISEVTQLINDDHVAAIVGSASNTIGGWYQLAESAKVPVIGGQTNGGALFTTLPMFFPTGTTSTVPTLDLAVKAGKLKLAVMYCTEVPVCATSAATLKASIATNPSEFSGLKIVYTGGVSGSAPSYAAQCLAAQQAGADSLVISDGAAVSLRVMNNCGSQGFKPTLIGSGAEADNTWLADTLFNGVQVYQPNFPWIADSTPQQQAFQSALKQYAPQELTSATYNPNDAQVWAALEVFATAVDMAKPTTFNSAAVLAALYALPANFTVPSLTPPLTYKKNSPNPAVNCYFLVQIESGKYTVSNNGTYTCPGGKP